MNYNPNIHNRRSIRLKGYDYTQPGLYFITICTHQRECLFGEIVEGVVSLNSIGLSVQACWQRLSNHFPNLELDVFIIMPNHLHGILILKDDIDREKGKEFYKTSLTKSESSQPIINNQGEAFRQDSLTESERSLRNALPNGRLRQRPYGTLKEQNQALLGLLFRILNRFLLAKFTEFVKLKMLQFGNVTTMNILLETKNL